MEARGSGGGIVALALGASDDIHWRLDGEACRFSAWCSAALAPGETRSVAFWAAVNLEHDGAAVTNVHLRRIGARAALEATLRWLEARAQVGLHRRRAGRARIGQRPHRGASQSEPALLQVLRPRPRA